MFVGTADTTARVVLVCAAGASLLWPLHAGATDTELGPSARLVVVAALLTSIGASVLGGSTSLPAYVTGPWARMTTGACVLSAYTTSSLLWHPVAVGRLAELAYSCDGALVRAHAAGELAPPVYERAWVGTTGALLSSSALVCVLLWVSLLGRWAGDRAAGVLLGSVVLLDVLVLRPPWVPWNNALVCAHTDDTQWAVRVAAAAVLHFAWDVGLTDRPGERAPASGGLVYAAALGGVLASGVWYINGPLVALVFCVVARRTVMLTSLDVLQYVGQRMESAMVAQ